MLYMTLSGLEFLAERKDVARNRGRMLLEIEFLEFLGEDSVFRNGINQK